jgi:hypothetical protein
MQTSFIDLVGTSVVPAQCFDSDELTALTPDLDMANAVHDMGAQASEAAGTLFNTACGDVCT